MLEKSAEDLILNVRSHSAESATSVPPGEFGSCLLLGRGTVVRLVTSS